MRTKTTKRLALPGAAALIAGTGTALVAAAPAQAQEAQLTSGAAPICADTTYEDADGIETTTGSGPEPTVELVSEGVKIGTTEFSGQGAGWWQEVDPVPLANVTSLSYDLHTISTASAGGSGAGVGPNMPSYQLLVRLADDTEATLVYEPYYSDEWRDVDTANEHAEDFVGLTHTWDVDEGYWWSNEDGLAGIGSGGSYASNQTLAEIVEDHEGIEVIGFGFRQSWADGLTVAVNNVHFGTDGGCQNHTWEPLVPVTPEAPGFTQATCDSPGVVSIPEADGVVYDGAEDGQELEDGAEITVTASPAKGYAFPAETQAEWTFKAEAGDCSAGEEESDDSDELAATGSSSLGMTAGLAAVLLIAGAGLAFWARPRIMRGRNRA